MPAQNTPKKKTRRGSPHAAPEIRQAQLVDAAITSFGRHGYHGTTIDGVAELSGLSKGTVYRFFDSKDDLLLAVVNAWEHSVEEQFARLPRSGNVLDDLRAYCYLSIERYVERPELKRVWLEFFMHDAPRERVAELNSQMRKRFIKDLKAGVSKRQIKCPSVAASADALMVLMEGSMVLAAVDPDFNLDKKFSGIWDVFASAHSK